MDPLRQALSEFVKEVQGDESQDDFGNRLGVTQQTISNFRAGRIPLKELEKIALIASKSIGNVLIRIGNRVLELERPRPVQIPRKAAAHRSR